MLRNTEVTFSVWDLGGQREFLSMPHNYYQISCDDRQITLERQEAVRAQARCEQLTSELANANGKLGIPSETNNIVHRFPWTHYCLCP